MWFPPAEKDSLPVLVSLIFHLFCSNLFSRSVGAQLSREGNKNYILVRCAGWIVRRLVRRSTEPSLGVESQECVADSRVKLWVLSEMGLVTKVQKPCRKKKILKGKLNCDNNMKVYCANKRSLIKLLCQQKLYQCIE